MLGGFGRGIDDAAQDQQMLVAANASGAVNYAKQALAALVWSTISDVAQVQAELTRLKKHFLTPFAFASNANDKYSLSQRRRKNVEYIKGYRRRKLQRPYLECVARAMVHTQGLTVPQEVLEDEDVFLPAFEEELKRTYRLNNDFENCVKCVAEPLLAEVVCGIQQDMASAAYEQETRHFFAFCDILVDQGLPAFNVVYAKFGEREMQLYKHACDAVESSEVHVDVDVDEALQNGLPKRWTNASTVRYAMNMLYTYVETFSMQNVQEAADHCERWLFANSRKNSETQIKQRERAGAWQVWRIRTTQVPQWRAAFEAIGGDFEEYALLEKQLQVVVGKGIFQHIARRHFSERVKNEMFAGNLQRIRQISVLPPQ